MSEGFLTDFIVFIVKASNHVLHHAHRQGDRSLSASCSSQGVKSTFCIMLIVKTANYQMTFDRW
jgi:hypothetical protein